MKLSRASAYAVRALIFLVRHSEIPRSKSHDIARADGTPDRCLRQVMKKLVDAGLLSSRTGTQGGYSLACPPEKITLLNILEAVDEPPQGGNQPVSQTEPAFDRLLLATCAEAAHVARQWLDAITLADLALPTPAHQKGNKGPRQIGDL